MTRLMEYLPRGNTLEEGAWHKRHTFLQWVLLLHLPVLFVFGLVTHHAAELTALVLLPLPLCLVAGHYVTHRRTASLFITAGLVWCSAALVGLSRGSIEAHFHFFVMIGFIALYQDWTPFLWNIVFVVISHGLGSAFQSNLIFNHSTGRWGPWLWSGIHGLAVLVACAGVVIFWKTTEDEQQKTLDLTKKLSDAEISRREFASDMLVNLARRNQSLLHRQLDIINQLEDQERDPDALGELFRLDHLATRIRRNAESLLVLSGEEPPRVWGEPVPLLDVVRASIAETEDLDRVAHFIDEHLAVKGHTVTDLTHLLAELVENAVRFSPPEANVIVKTRPHPAVLGAHLLTVEDWGIGMRPEDLAGANDVLANPREVDLSVSQRLGLQVIARLAQRHAIEVSLVPTPGCGLTAVVVLPPDMFAGAGAPTGAPVGAGTAVRGAAVATAAASAATSPMSSSTPWGLHASSPANGNGGRGEPQPVIHSPRAESERWPRVDDEQRQPEWPGWWRPFTEEDAEDGPPLAAPSLSVPDGPVEPSVPLTAKPTLQPPTQQPSAEPQLNQRVPQAHLAPELRLPDQQAEPRLNQRVPQAHLAPELRLPQPQPQAATPSAAPPEDVPPRQSQDALARYQASRRAARATVEEAATTGEWPRVDGGGRW